MINSESHRVPPSPLYADPVHHAPTDPTLIKGPDRNWWMFYTQRRSADTGPGVRWVHGTDIGIAISSDGGLGWSYAGIVEGIDPYPGRNTLWAPEIIRADGRFHMFTSYIRGVPEQWEGHARHIMHHTSEDLRRWTYHGDLPLSSDRVIDACAYPLPSGGWRLWYKDEAHGSTTWSVDSADLVSWSEPTPVITGYPHEGPNVFRLGEQYWMITDDWRGLAVHRSRDLINWRASGRLLDTPGSGLHDHGFGHHADVVVGKDGDGEVGWLFYFTHRTERSRLTDIHVAAVRAHGDELHCDRDEPVALDLAKAVPLPS